MSHPKFNKNFGTTPVEEISVSTRIFTKKYTERILRAAFEHAKKYEYKSVTVCEKPNVIRETSGMMYKMAQQIQKADYSNIELWNTNIDAQMMWLTKNPENYGVIVAGNMFGDIVSDGFAGLIGGLGFATSAQYNPETGIGVFEPTHGSAPKYADYEASIVNPIAMIETSCMMLDFIDEQDIARQIRKAVAEVIHFSGPPALINHENEADLAAEVALAVCGIAHRDIEPTMGGEDFSEMLLERPGAYLFIGNGNSADLHNPSYEFNDEVIPFGCSWFVTMAERRLPIELQG